MTRFKLMCFDFAFPRTSDVLKIPVFEIKSFVEDYMRIYSFDHLKLFMSQNDSIPFEYQFDVFYKDGKFWTERHLNQEGAVLND